VQPAEDSAPHRAREMAESFGSDPERYDRARPNYPQAMIDAIVAASPGPSMLSVGCGTGIDARQFQTAGCTVLGVDVDERMVAFARARGLDAEVAPFEAWHPGGRVFDAVVAGQAWHWIEPVAGAAKAAKVLRPDGRLALFWNMFQPAPEVARAFAAVQQRVIPDVPRNPWAQVDLDAYAPFFARPPAGIRQSGQFGEPEQWCFPWERSYTRDEWCEQMATSGEAGRLPSDSLQALLDGYAAAIDAWGGNVTMGYAAVVITAARLR
jgi:SAM-dependent methyltransferase